MQRLSAPQVVWGTFLNSPLWWFFFLGRFGILWLFSAAYAVWDFVVTLFSAAFDIFTNILYIVIAAAIFVGLLFIHLYWADFVHALQHIIIPTVGVIYNDFFVLIWNDIFLPVSNILIYTWDSLVQVIGFFIYFALNFIVTVFTLVTQLIGKLHLPQLFESLMEIITPLLKLVISVAQLLIKIGSKILVALIPILIAMMKIFFAYLKIVFKIYSFLFITIFRYLSGIIKAVVAVVRVVTRIFHIGSMAGVASRVLLSVMDGDRFMGKRDAGLQGATHEFAYDLYVNALKYYTLGQYEGFAKDAEAVHKGILAEDVYHSTNGFFKEPGDVTGDGNIERHLYPEDELHELERPGDKGSHAMPGSPGVPSAGGLSEAQKTAVKQSRERKQQQQRRPLELDEMDKKRTDFFDKLLKSQIDGLSKTEEDATEEDVQDELDSEANRRDEERALAMLSMNRGTSEKNYTDAGNEHRRNATSMEELHEELSANGKRWMFDYTHNMTAEEVFPGLPKDKRLRRAQLEKLTHERTPQEEHEVRTAAAAWLAAIEHGWYRAYKRHIHSGRFRRAVANSWKHLSGHETVEGWAQEKFGGGRYVSVAHFLHSVIPDFTNTNPILKRMKEADPEHKTRVYHHDFVREHLGHKSGILPREWFEMSEAQERWNEEQDYLTSGNGQPSVPWDDLWRVHHPLDRETLYEGGNHEAVFRRSHRKLLIFDLPLEFLYEILSLIEEIFNAGSYENDCFTTKVRNILCIPEIPLSWKLPRLNVSSIFISDNLDAQPQCLPIWRETDCIFCWDGFVNSIREIQFLIYFLDIISYILIFGIFVPRPSEWLGLLGRVFPPLSPLINLYLLYPVGDFPAGSQFGCFFINLYYLFFLVMVLLVIYFIGAPLANWFLRWLRDQLSIYAAYKAGVIAHRADQEYFADSYLNTLSYQIESAMVQQMRKSLAPGRPMPIQSAIAGQPQRTPAQMEAGVPASQQAQQQRPLVIPRRRQQPDLERLLATEDPAAVHRLAELHQQVEQERLGLFNDLTRISGQLGMSSAHLSRLVRKERVQALTAVNPASAAAAAANEAAANSRERRIRYIPQPMINSWSRVSEMLNVPLEMTPAYVRAVSAHHETGDASLLHPGLELITAASTPVPTRAVHPQSK